MSMDAWVKSMLLRWVNDFSLSWLKTLNVSLKCFLYLLAWIGSQDWVFNHFWRSLMLIWKSSFMHLIRKILIKQSWWLVKVTPVSHRFTTVDILRPIRVRHIAVILFFSLNIARIVCVALNLSWILGYVHFVVSWIIDFIFLVWSSLWW